MSNTPSDVEIIMLDAESGVSVRAGKGAVTLARAVLAKWGTPAPVGVEPAQRQYYYKVDGCPARNSESPDCICWHDAGTGPRATADPTLVSWRGADQALAMGRVPQGWKAVPVNPTPEMWKAAKTVPDPNPPHPPHYGLVWDAMLAAAPSIKQGGQQ